MNRYARTAPGQLEEVVGIDRPYSFFDLIDRRFPACDPVRRILSQVRMQGGRTMVIEKLDQPSDLAQENEDLMKRNGDLSSSAAVRLSFFSKKFTTTAGLVGVADEEFVGYAILKTDTAPSFGAIQRVYESVIRPGRHDNNFVRGQQTWRCVVQDKKFHVPGYLYAQQNGLTNVCAHVALRTAAARFHRDGDMSYREMNTLLGIDHFQTKTGDGRGLTTTQMVQVLEEAGARCFQADYTQARPNPPPFQKYLYGSIESGFPAIVIFGVAHSPGDLHAVPVFGHTFNQDTWVPSADCSYFRVGGGTTYLPSESWLSTFIAHDDNWGSNFCIPRHYLRTRGPSAVGSPPSSSSPSASECVAHVIATLPKQVKLNPIRAEVIGADYLFTILPQLPTNRDPWAKRLREYARRHLLVLRPYLLTIEEYTAHLAKLRDWRGDAIEARLVAALRAILPKEMLWMIELSVPELFSANLRKVGEVLVRAEVWTRPVRDLACFLLARLPGYFALYEKGDASHPQYQFIESGAAGHVQLYGCESKL